MWGEDEAKRGSAEVASSVFDYIKKKVAEEKNEFIFYSDNCGGQNKNRFVFMMFMVAALKFNVKITHRFLECGHSQNEGDSMHSAIESASKNQNVYCPEDWKTIIRGARRENQFEIVDLRQEMIYNFKFLVDQKQTVNNVNKEKVSWSRIREVFVTHEKPDSFFYKVQLEGAEYEEMRWSEGGKNYNLKDHEWQNEYNGNLGVPAGKLKDLLSMCTGIKRIIPSQYVYFYLTLKKRTATTREVEGEENNDL